MTLAAYGDFLARGRAWSLWLTAFCAICMMLVHLMCLAILAPLAIIWLRWDGGDASAAAGRWAGRRSSRCCWVDCPWPYWYFLVHNYSPSLPIGTSLWSGWFSPFWVAIISRPPASQHPGRRLAIHDRPRPSIFGCRRADDLAGRVSGRLGRNDFGVPLMAASAEQSERDSGRSSGFCRIGDVDLPIPFRRQPPCIGWSAIFQRDVDCLRYLRVDGGGLAVGRPRLPSPGTPGEGWGEALQIVTKGAHPALSSSSLSLRAEGRSTGRGKMAGCRIAAGASHGRCHCTRRRC